MKQGDIMSTITKFVACVAGALLAIPLSASAQLVFEQGDNPEAGYRIKAPRWGATPAPTPRAERGLPQAGDLSADRHWVYKDAQKGWLPQNHMLERVGNDWVHTEDCDHGQQRS
jgi:hypothetical protein